jgi:hypothetical protein
MEKVFIVIRRFEYEGDTVERVFANYKDALAYADELEVHDSSKTFEYDVYERDVY